MSNLPPGIQESDVPGNRPEDAEWDEFWDWTISQIYDELSGVTEARRAILIGIAAVNAENEVINAEINDRVAEAIMVRDTYDEEFGGH